VTTFDGHIFGSDQPCFGCGPRHPFGFHLTFEDLEDRVVSRFVPTEHHQGPPGIMHGGLVGALADEVGAWTVFLKVGMFAVTTSFDGRLRKPVRIGAEVEACGKLTSSGRIAVVEVTLTQGDVLAFEGRFRFAVLDRAAAEKLIGAPLSGGWAGLGERRGGRGT
jgi:acyl-coenzyme A thioesterase PaaI-like protein